MRPSRSSRALAAMLALVLLAGPGCARQYIVPVDELRKLDGYGTPPGTRPPAKRLRERNLKTMDGSIIPFNLGMPLRLVGPEVSGRFRHIQVTPTQFEGVLLETDELLKVDLAAIHFVQVEGTDPVGTLIAILGAISVIPIGLWAIAAIGSTL